MKKEYLIVGSNNFWYASCLNSLKEVESTIKQIKRNPHNYEDSESGHNPEKPEMLYIYEAKEIKHITIKP